MLSAQALLAQRWTAVDTAIRNSHRRLGTLPPAPNGLDQIPGLGKDDSTFDEVLAFSRALWTVAGGPDAGRPGSNRV